MKEKPLVEGRSFPTGNNLMTPFFKLFAALSCTYFHARKSYRTDAFSGDFLEEWAREKGFCQESYDGSFSLAYGLKFAESWAALWSLTVDMPKKVPLDWALTQKSLINTSRGWVYFFASALWDFPSCRGFA